MPFKRTLGPLTKDWLICFRLRPPVSQVCSYWVYLPMNYLKKCFTYFQAQNLECLTKYWARPATTYKNKYFLNFRFRCFTHVPSRNLLTQQLSYRVSCHVIYHLESWKQYSWYFSKCIFWMPLLQASKSRNNKWHFFRGSNISKKIRDWKSDMFWPISPTYIEYISIDSF